MKTNEWFSREIIFFWYDQNMANCFLGNFENKVLFLIVSVHIDDTGFAVKYKTLNFCSRKNVTKSEP